MSTEIEKAKECLKSIKQSLEITVVEGDNIEICPTGDYECVNELKYIWNTLNQAEEIQKALEIIVKYSIISHYIRFSDTVEEYNRYAKFNNWVELTQAEFDLVKKVVARYE